MGPQSRSGCCGVEKHFLPVLGIKLEPSRLWTITILTAADIVVITEETAQGKYIVTCQGTCH
jgi:hypothetical protein